MATNSAPPLPTGSNHPAVSLTEAMEAAAQSAEDYLHLGNLFAQSGRLAEALARYDRAIAMRERFGEAHFNRGVVLKGLNQPEAALASYDQAIAINPAFAPAHFNRGIVLHELERPAAALASYECVIRIDADHAGAHCNRGIVLELLGQLDEAVTSFDEAIALNSRSGEALYNRGNVLRKLRRFDAALASYDEAIAVNPRHAESHYNRANLLRELKNFDLALASYDRAIEISGDYVEAYANRGNLLGEAMQFEAAIASYDHALRRMPNFRFLSGQRLHAKMQLCDWTGFDAEVADLAARIERDAAATPPYHWLGVSRSARLQRQAAETWVREQWPADQSLPAFPRIAAIPAAAGHEKLRIGYFSADFRNHPVSILAAELFETHDRARFEISAFAFGPPSEDAMRSRLAGAFDRFLEVRGRSDREIALLARELHIDIAVDLGGFTGQSRPGIFALRAAPLQVSFLGYPGTLGAPYMDYLVADPTLIPEACRAHYREHILYLPDSTLPHDSQQPIAEAGLTRRQAGLPDLGFVFCGFNNVAKITPATFAGWMRILTQVPGSVLWLSTANPTAQSNLRLEAVRLRVDAERLVFAPRLASLPEHLARHRLADLFLDTLPYNAHTTASDALWAGLPVLTQIGETFAGRVAASLLTAIDLPDLITHSAAQFEALAVELATDRQRLAHLRHRLAQNRLTTPLFDTRRFTQHLEAAFAAIQTRYQVGLPPADILVQARREAP